MTTELRTELAQIDYPALTGASRTDDDADIVSLGIVGDVEVDDGVAHVELALGAPHSPAESRLAERVREVVREAGYEPSLSIAIDDDTPAGLIEDAPNVIAVSSGKGGVGKSTVAVNLATAIAERGANVGLFDADVYGPNIPRMLGVHDHPGMAEDDETIIPVERHGLKLMSIGFLVGEDDPVIWRGAMVDKVLTQLYDDTRWGDLDYFVVDLPPGTGDAQLTMLQQMPVLGSVVVTTPQDVALDNARKGARMFDRHDTEVLGFVENMSTFVCPNCGDAHDVFDAGGGERIAEEFDRPLLAEIPLDPSIREACETGEPVVSNDDAEASRAFESLAEGVMDAVGALRRRSHSETARSTVDESRSAAERADAQTS
ncbi:Scaffold protein for [4Fe-4S] cluster assembly, MRP-like, similar to chloroplast-targeted plant protein HCF101 [Halorubrum sp. DM2]|uniref:Mrp/NBP35 family ATP-binding protein n=1 Tax=Halorubrum sp. DM2 TaxID=2527867 RepID=UPI0024B81708|nr:Mrp/NBP35 family ATP-binding protein [Halorubrum sp. DM2]VTT85627.1 Scaffold protein for [4Fe-4S] cluster assembly, MRP-like, similar to chloroplast-targeted plant protein HCF101 [Halorubrum sp. DM2]